MKESREMSQSEEVDKETGSRSEEQIDDDVDEKTIHVTPDAKSQHVNKSTTERRLIDDDDLSPMRPSIEFASLRVREELNFTPPRDR